MKNKNENYRLFNCFESRLDIKFNKRKRGILFHFAFIKL